MEFLTVASASGREEDESAGKRETFLSSRKPGTTTSLSVSEIRPVNLIRSVSLYERLKY